MAFILEMTIKEGLDNEKVTGPNKSMTGKFSGEEKVTERSPVGGNPEDHRNKPVIAAKASPKAMLTGPKTGIQLSNGVEKVAKIANSSVKEVKSPVSREEASKHIPHYLRPSTSSCHDACKYGSKAHFESSDAPKHTHAKVANKTSLAPSKSAVPKTYKTPKSIRSDNSLDGSSSTPVGHSSSLVGHSSTPVGQSSKISPKEKTLGNIVQYEVKLVKSPPEKPKNLPSKPSSDKKPKLVITPPTTSSRSAKSAGNAKTITPPSKLSGNGHGTAKTIARSPRSAGIAHGTAKTANAQPNKKAALKTREHLLKKTEKKTSKSDSPRSASSITSSLPQEEKPNEVGTLEVCGSDTEELGNDNQILANVGGDAHQFYEHSQSAGESSDKEHEHVLMKDNDYEDDHSVKEHSNDGIMIPIARETTDCDEYVGEWSNLEPYGENLAMDYDDQEFDDQYSEYSEYSENSESGSHDEQGESARVRKERRMMAGEEDNQGVEKLRFRRGQELPVQEEKRALERRRFRRGKNIDHSDSNPQPENVVLRHQDVQGRKASEEFMLNHVIEETVNKLAHTRKSKVKALVGAFETVISLKESESNELKHAGTKDLTQLSTLQECT